MSDVIPFEFENEQVRTMTDGTEALFIAKDVCLAFGDKNPKRSIGRLDEDEKRLVTVLDRLGREQEATAINESGLYALLFQMQPEKARKDGGTHNDPHTEARIEKLKRFKRWVTHEVLPQIRKTGGYGQADPMEALSDPATLRQTLLSYTERVLALEQTVEEQAPKVAALDRLATAEGSMCLTDAAKALQVRPIDFIRHMHAHGWIYRRAGNGQWLGYQRRAQQGLLEHKVTTVSRSDGSEMVKEQVRVTPKGLERLALEVGDLAG